MGLLTTLPSAWIPFLTHDGKFMRETSKTQFKHHFLCFVSSLVFSQTCSSLGYLHSYSLELFQKKTVSFTSVFSAQMYINLTLISRKELTAFSTSLLNISKFVLCQCSYDPIVLFVTGSPVAKAGPKLLGLQLPSPYTGMTGICYHAWSPVQQSQY